MFYIIIQIMLLFFCIMINDEKKRDYIYKLFFLFLVLILVIRFGQGSDYFNYQTIYNLLDDRSQIWVVGDPGFNILIVLAKSIGINYQGFSAIISIISMALMYRFFDKYSKNKLLALTIFYPIYYMVFWYSAIRQGLVMSIFCGILLQLLLDGKYIKYVIGLLIASTLHLSSLFLLILIIVKFIPLYKIKNIIISIVALGIYHALGVQDILIKLLPSSIYDRIYVYLSGQISLSALFSRTIFFIIVLYLFMCCNDKEKEESQGLFNIYVFGFLLYVLLMRSPTLASRLNFYIKILECIIIANLLPIKYNSIKEYFKTGALALILIVMLIKNISSFLLQGHYYSYISVADYPFITIFNKDDIHSYRDIKIDERYKGIFPSKYQWPFKLDDEFESLVD